MEPRHPLVLGVETSLLRRPWRSRLDVAGQGRALQMAQLHGLPDLLTRVLASRDLHAGSCVAYLDPTVRGLMPDPDTLCDMGLAVDHLVRAIRSGEQVAVLGDYDVDGAAATALIVDYLRAAGLDPTIYIPDRMVDGYGPSVAAIRSLAAEGATLLITVDCGSTSLAPLAEAARLGLRTVVIDHHQLGTDLPDAVAVVNPNRHDDLSGLGHLCAAGVVFMVLVGLQRALKAQGFWAGRTAPDLLESLDLVGLATVADVVPLTGLNRAFVTKGSGRHGAPGPARLGGLVRCRGRGRAALTVSSRVPGRAAHQCRRTHRRLGARHALAADARPDRCRPDRGRPRSAQPGT